MKKILVLLVMLALQACSDTTAQPPTADVHNGYDISSKLETTTQLSSDADATIPAGIYFSDKKCSSQKDCKNFNPEKIDRKYYLSRNQGSNEAMYYLLVKDNTYYIYSLQFLDEDHSAVGSWSQMKESKATDLSFEIESIEQVMGSDYMGRYDDANLNNKLNTLANQSGLLEIGSLLEGSKIPTHETIKFLRTDNGYKVDCNDYIESYEKTVDQLYKQDMAAGYHFYYECSNGNEIYFQNLN